MVRKQEAYQKPILAWQHFEQYILRQKSLAHIIKHNIIKEDAETVTVFLGAAKQHGSSTMKGYVKSPHSYLRHVLKIHPKLTLIDVNEYCTTKTCSKCGIQEPKKDENMKDEDKRFRVYRGTKGHRWAHCRDCQILWNRDINAGINILRRGLEDEPN